MGGVEGCPVFYLFNIAECRKMINFEPQQYSHMILNSWTVQMPARSSKHCSQYDYTKMLNPDWKTYRQGQFTAELNYVIHTTGQAMRLSCSFAVAFSSRSLLTWHVPLEIPTRTAAEYEYFRTHIGYASFLAAAVPAQTATAPIHSWLLTGAPLAAFTTLSVLPAEFLCEHVL